MKNITLIIGFLAALWIEGSALQCHVCVGSTTSDCAKNVTSAMGTQTCYKPKPHQKVPANSQSPFFAEEGEALATNSYVDESVVRKTTNRITRSVPSDPEYEFHCTIITTKATKYGTGLAIRECGYAPKGENICDTLRKRKRNIVDCSSCDSDFCN